MQGSLHLYESITVLTLDQSVIAFSPGVTVQGREDTDTLCVGL